MLIFSEVDRLWYYNIVSNFVCKKYLNSVWFFFRMNIEVKVIIIYRLYGLPRVVKMIRIQFSTFVLKANLSFVLPKRSKLTKLQNYLYLDYLCDGIKKCQEQEDETQRMYVWWHVLLKILVNADHVTLYNNHFSRWIDREV